MKYFRSDPKTAYEAKSEAQRIAFAPIMFQACRVLRDSGILDAVREGGAAGLTLAELASKVSLPRYGIKVLSEAGLGIGLFYLDEDRFKLTKLGHYILRDTMTRINMDVVHDVCYRGLFDLDKSIEQGRPAGLKTLGNWKTLYEGLSCFTPAARESWLAFDHYYSELAFPAALPLVLKSSPKRLLDVGGNTGKWAMQCAKYDPNVRITIADLPQQLDLARSAICQEGLEHRVDFFPINILDESQSLPKGYDALWMSQFLDCFSEKEIVRPSFGNARRLVSQGWVVNQPGAAGRLILESIQSRLALTHEPRTQQSPGRHRPRKGQQCAPATPGGSHDPAAER